MNQADFRVGTLFASKELEKGVIRLSNLARNKYSPSVDIRKKESGDRSYPIWLLVNPKYPADRHDIWAPILDEIQDRVYRKLNTRIDTENILIKNTVSDIKIVPRTVNHCASEEAETVDEVDEAEEAEEAEEIVKLRESVLVHQPKILITFGTMTYEFVKRVFDRRPEQGPKYWSTTNLEDEFERSIANFDIKQTNSIPLLRRIMKSGKFHEDHNYFSWEENEHYFRDVGAKIADRIIENKDSLKIWIE